ncbi:CUB and zona pellucida-like domain-containing protein 1 [Nematostella vectensis]|uniref:CUB and zona pellucida-like domain-containing protein 1 n=1 Tax=Nematostella vectensis TaxID=45351 RepID=UPI00138FC328|nr:CUB and zona pellucida-like domain-containing protein 1 [Nematostella vectensis]
MASCWYVLFVAISFSTLTHAWRGFRGGIITWTFENDPTTKPPNHVSWRPYGTRPPTTWRPWNSYTTPRPFPWAPANPQLKLNLLFRTAWSLSSTRCRYRDDYYLYVMYDIWRVGGGSYSVWEYRRIGCLDYSESEDWAEVFFNATFPSDIRLIRFRSNPWDPGCCWIGMNDSSYSGAYFNLEASVNLTTLSQVRPNSSPFSSLPLIVNLTHIREVIRIPVVDPDGDKVVCRWHGNESSFPFAVLDEENCTLTYNGNSVTGTIYPVLLDLEDYPSWETTYDNNTIISRTNLQFTVQIKHPIVCHPGYCKNGGTCYRPWYWGLYCACPTGYSGLRCESQVSSSVSCGERHMQIQLGKASFPGVSAGSLQLRSSQCIGRDGGSHIYFTFGLDECGTQHNETDTEIIYSNEVIYRDYWNDTIITRQKKIAAQFVCVYKREGHASTSFSIRKTASLKLGSNGTITFLMDIYRTHAYLSAYRWWEYPIRVGLNDPLFIQYSVQSNKTGIYVFADSCYATNTGSPNTWPRYKFIDKGCPKDSGTQYNYRLSPVQRFSIRSFRFMQQHADQVVYLHCRLVVCHRSLSSRCQQRCDHALIRKRRGLDQSENQEVDLFVPLMGDKSDVRFGGQKGSVHNKPMIAGLGALGGLLILVSAAFVFVTMRKKQDVNDKPAIELDAVASAANQGIEEDAEVKEHAQTCA